MFNEILLMFKNFIRKHKNFKALLKSLSTPNVAIFGYLYGCYLTIRYVDKYTKFPAILFRKGIIRLAIVKGIGSKLEIGTRLIIEPLSFRRVPSSLVLGDLALIKFDNDFCIGDDVQIVAYDKAVIHIGGKRLEDSSGISAKSLIHAHSIIRIGTDVIIAQDTYLTDCDWHPIAGTPFQDDLIIGDHVWIATGAKLLKGTYIGNFSIVACGAIVTGHSFPDKSLIAGVPARIAKSNIGDWRSNL